VRLLAEVGQSTSTTSGSQQLGDEIGRHVWWWGTLQPRPTGFFSALINWDTVYMTILVMIILVILALLARRNMSIERPTGVQNLLEAAMEFINGFVTDQLGLARGATVFPLAMTLFLFILLANYIGLVPVPAIALGSGKDAPTLLAWHSPTSDLNTTAALALIVFFYLQFASVSAHHGLVGWFRHTFLAHGVFFAPISFVEELARPLTLAFRLFGNIFAGEVLILVFALLLPWWAGHLPYLFALGLGIFVGAIQAFIFTMLTIAYVGIATSTEHE
jgi:F-type H+-transporting ATPase subunit a